MTVEREYSYEVKEAIEMLRARMKNDIPPELFEDTLMFYRFLKARDFNINNAEKMLRAHLQTRKDKNYDNILTTHKPSEVIEKYVPHDRICVDKDGCPVRYLPFGRVDAKGVIKSCTHDDLERAGVYAILSDVAFAKEQSQKLGKCIDKFPYIIDLEGLTFGIATDKTILNTVIRLLIMYQDNFPERLKAVYVINSSVYFKLAFSLIKHFLANTILEKFRVYSSDDDWKSELLKAIDAEELPAFLGGKRTDPDGDPMCKTIICQGGVIPERYYLRNTKATLVNSPEALKIVLRRASMKEILVNVEEENSLIEWEFQTKGHDIGFGVFHQVTVDGKIKKVDLIPLERIKADQYSESGMCRLKEAGVYIVLFDNRYSWFRTKKVFYKLKITKQEEHETLVNSI